LFLRIFILLVKYAALLICALAIAADAPPAPPIPTDAQRAKFWRTASEMQAANDQLKAASEAAKRAQDTFLKIQAELCGTGFDFAWQKDGEPGCKAKSDSKD